MVARKTFEAECSAEGLRHLASELDAYARKLEKANTEFVSRLTDLGFDVASVELTSARGGGYDSAEGDFDVIMDSTGMITAARFTLSGDTVLFYEFGAGIYYNRGNRHPLASKLGYGVGTYPGQKHAFEPGWIFYDDNGEKRYTHGTEAAMPMYKASVDIRVQLKKIAKEVFQNVI